MTHFPPHLLSDDCYIPASQITLTPNGLIVGEFVTLPLFHVDKKGKKTGKEQRQRFKVIKTSNDGQSVTVEPLGEK